MARIIVMRMLVAVILLGAGVESQANIVTTSAWTSQETDLFSSSGSREGASAVWTGNTLTMTYTDALGSAAISQATFNATAMPLNTIGISFDITSTLTFSRASLFDQVWTSSHEFLGSNSVSNTFTSTGAFGSGSLSEWGWTEFGFGPQTFDTVPSSTVGDTTSIQFLFSDNVLNGDLHQIIFKADGLQPNVGDIWLSGTTTYSNVSWIIDEGKSTDGTPPSVVPLPGAALLGMVGFGMVGILRRWVV